MSVWNEYDKLKTVFIGKRYDEDITYDVFKSKCSKNDLDAWQRINYETNQDLDSIEDLLKSKGVKVYRPDISRYWDIKKHISDWGPTEPLDPGPVRDWCFTYGDLIITTQLSFPGRHYEHIFWEDAFDDLTNKGKTIISTRFNTSFNHKHHLKFLQYDKLIKKDFIEDVKEIYGKVKNKKMFKGIKKLCLNYLNSDDPIDERFYIYILTEEFRNKKFIHAASYLKHNNKIFGSPQGTLSGIESLEKIVKTFYPDTIFHYLEEMCHLDGLQMIIDEDLKIASTEGFGNKNEKFMMFRDREWDNLNSFYLNVAHKDDNFETDIPEEFFRDLKEIFDSQKDEIFYVSDYLTHWIGMRGYYQKVDFDFNGLCISPKEIIGNFFNKKNADIIEKELDVKIHNLPLRHRWVLDGGIHCYTQDIDRENEL